MHAVDTNVLVRLITRDDVKQVAIADEFVKRGAWVSHLALAEAMWVLATVYGRDADEIAAAIEMLMQHQHLTLQDPEVVAAALADLPKHPKPGFFHFRLLETTRKAGDLPPGP